MGHQGTGQAEVHPAVQHDRPQPVRLPDGAAGTQHHGPNQASPGQPRPDLGPRRHGLRRAARLRRVRAGHVSVRFGAAGREGAGGTAPGADSTLVPQGDFAPRIGRRFAPRVGFVAGRRAECARGAGRAAGSAVRVADVFV
uniref:(northern house mosquito) hypothetical protein n=1 Tax=Culex pipiens TaxID=7175 RepID=A0A8D7ZW82_CULPI